MPVQDDVGYGASTPLKHKHLKAIFGMHLAIAHAVLNKPNNGFRRTYRYIELTAGKGFTPESGDRGSPLLFLDQIHSGKDAMPYRADFIDDNQTNIEELERNVEAEAKKCQWGQTSTRYHFYDYQQGIPLLLATRDPFELGMVFADPSGNLPNFTTLKYINEMRSRMEILVYISTTNVKRLFKRDSKQLADYMNEVGKKYWLIREPMSWDKHKWTFLLGTNTEIIKDYGKIGLYRLESDEAQEIFRKLNLTEVERMNEVQPPLF